MMAKRKRDSSSTPPAVPVALSIRQPWATLVVYGIKTIEIRTWSTKRTGLIYIHAGREADRRDDAWRFVPKELLEFTERRGGIVGQARLRECLAYQDIDVFSQDVKKHFNRPDWFKPPRLYGLVFEEAAPHDFVPCKGELYFFPVATNIKTGRD
jgi:hypothetical protein